MSVYTKTGDKGKTSLYGGKRVLKSDPRIEAVGTVDELQSVLGVVQSLNKDNKLGRELLKIQNDLFEIGWAIAKPYAKLDLGERVKDFEKEIDELTAKLPQLDNFILPGGGLTGSHLHQARSVARRAERSIVRLGGKESVQDSILAYMNRLSDLFFMMARYINYKEKKKEQIWKSR